MMGTHQAPRGHYLWERRKARKRPRTVARSVPNRRPCSRLTPLLPVMDTHRAPRGHCLWERRKARKR
ncbi:hypothetical protein RZS08_66930, partial [Arthrospira platensis SPKY1]|nr:hypothetical protein [Arthrospira platensis SPKY1]